MEIRLKLGVLGGNYLAWIGFGLRAVQAFPSTEAYLYIGLAFLFSVGLMLYLGNLDDSVRRESERTGEPAETLRELVDNIHFCLNPNECERCSAFLWALVPSVLASAASNELLVKTFRNLPTSSSVIIVLSFLVLFVAVAIHGILNGLQRTDTLPFDLPQWIFSSIVKGILGALAGISTMSTAVGVYLFINSG